MVLHRPVEPAAVTEQVRSWYDKFPVIRLTCATSTMTADSSCWRGQLHDLWGKAPRNRSAGTGSKPPPAALIKSQGR